MGDPHEMFVMVKEYSGVRVLAMAHCRSNRRWVHGTYTLLTQPLLSTQVHTPS